MPKDRFENCVDFDKEEGVCLECGEDFAYIEG